MRDPVRHLTARDRFFCVLDQWLKTFPGSAAAAPRRETPRPDPADTPALEPGEVRHAAGLMRVNHAGEVAAQALYHGQALVATETPVREFLLNAAAEEGDHLAWCEARLAALGARPSLLNPLWYAGASAIGALAGLAGDRLSLGFVAETERQVEGHLDRHLQRLPPGDAASRAILEAMKADEVRHGAAALERGAAELPPLVTALMGLTSKLMTRTAYWC